MPVLAGRQGRGGDRRRPRRHRGRRLGAADRRGRSALRAHPARLARGKGFKGIVANRGQQALALAREYLPTAITLDVFLPDMLGWTVLNNLKLDPTHAPHPGADAVGRGGAPARPVARRVLLPGQAGDHRRARGRVRPAQGLRRAAHQAAAGRSRTTTASARASSSCSATTTSRSTAVGDRRRGARRRCASSAFDCCVVDLRLPDMTGFELLETAAGRARAARHPDRGLHRQGADRRGGGAAARGGQEHRAQGRAVARAAARRDRAVPAPRDRRPAREPSGRCSSACTARPRRCAAARCWSSTTTRATSSR